MGFRYNKSIRLGKSLRMNISKSGVGVSAGVKGLRVSTGPRGSHVTASIPGTGISYRKKIGDSKKKSQQQSQKRTTSSSSSSMPQAILGSVAKMALKSATQVAIESVKNSAKETISPEARSSIPKHEQEKVVVKKLIPEANFSAPKYEKEFVKALKEYQSGNPKQALHYMVPAIYKDAGVGLIAATIFAKYEEGTPQAIKILEAIVQADVEFPTSLMKRYLIDVFQVQIDITPTVSVTVPADGLLATLLLVELYQGEGRIDDAIGLLEEIEELAGEPVVTLSLCELYAHQGVWDGIIERAKDVRLEDDITLETIIFYGRAIQEKGLHKDAIEVFGNVLTNKLDNYNPVLLREVAYWQAVSYLELGEKKQAKKAFLSLYKEAPDFRDVTSRVALFWGNE